MLKFLYDIKIVDDIAYDMVKRADEVLINLEDIKFETALNFSN